MEQSSQQGIEGFEFAGVTNETGEGAQLARGFILDELPGFAFALITLFWVLSMMVGLIWPDTPSEVLAHLRALTQACFHPDAFTIASRFATGAGLARSCYGFFDPRSPA